MTDATPNPGSDEARELGCICAVIDNNRGRFAPWPPDGWWITEDCPVHAPALPCPYCHRPVGDDPARCRDGRLACTAVCASFADSRKPDGWDGAE